MFEKSENLQATVLGLTFRVKDARQKDPTKVAEVTFEAPLDADLAADVLPEMANDLFTSRGKPKVDMAEASFHIPAGQYLMSVRMTPAGRQQKLSGCIVRNVCAYKDSNDANKGWLLGFTVAFVLLTPEEVMPFIKHLRASLFLTFEEQEPKMELDPEDGSGAGVDVEVDKSGNVRSMKDAKKKDRTH